MKIFLKLQILGLVLLFGACDGSDSDKKDSIESFGFDGSSYLSLEAEINNLTVALSYEQTLQNNPDRRKGQISSALALAGNGARIFRKFAEENNRDRLKTAFDIFTSAIGIYESYGILDFEQSRFERVFNRVRELRFLIGRKIGEKDLYTWVLYNHDFAGGIEPYFNSFPGVDERNEVVKWVSNFQTGISKAKVQGRKAFSWISSKPFSIKNIKNPSFTYFTQFTVVAPNPKYSLKEVIDKVFQTYIILDQIPGESPEDIDDSRKIRVNYKIDDLPLARNFHDAWLPKISLEKYKDHKVSIAFLFDTRQIKDTQYYIWDIFDFELHGAGVFKEPASVFSPDFQDNLGGFKSLSLSFGGSRWSSSKTGMAVYSGASDTDAFVVSSIYNVAETTESLRLVVTDSLKGTAPFEAEILVSKNYHGGVDPSSPEIKWDVLSSNSTGFEKRSEIFDLSEYRGNSIVLGFRFKVKAKDRVSWFVDQVVFETEGSGLTEIAYSVVDPENKFILASQDLLKLNFKDIQRIYESEEASPKWKKGTKGISISGFVPGGDPKSGKSQMIFPEINLTDATTNKLRILYSLQHAKAEPAVKFHVRESCVDIDPCDHKWIELLFPKRTFTMRLNKAVMSPWVGIPDAFDGVKVQISTTYKSSKGNTPGFSIKALQVGGLQ